MIFQAILSNKAHPEYGDVRIPFPISADQYDEAIDWLEAMEIGDIQESDCHVDDLESKYPVLNCLINQSVNVDELDYLAKRLDSFDDGEDVKFEAMASKLGLSDIKDLINLTFCCQGTTVITDFSDLEQVGKSHSLTINGGFMSVEEYDKLDGLSVSLELIQSGGGTVTPFGVVYDNGMKLEQIYEGCAFPQYLHDIPLLTLGVPIESETGDPTETAWLYLPATEQQISRTLQRSGLTGHDAMYFIEDSSLPPNILSALEHPEAIMDLNCLCHAIQVLNTAEREKLKAVILMAQPSDADEVRQLAENLDQFGFVPDVQTLEDYGRYMIRESGHFEYDENLEDFYDYRLFGELRTREEGGEFTDLGYVSYHGTLALEELMQADPAESELEMGGIM